MTTAADEATDLERILHSYPRPHGTLPKREIGCLRVLSGVASHIEDYALIGDTVTAALVGFDGSLDWLCFPRFDSPACFAALIGDEENGRWSIAPSEPTLRRSRRYRRDTFVLETTFECENGSVTLTDTMAMGGESRIVRVVTGVQGRVAMRLAYAVRFDYGAIVPWVRRIDEGLLAIAGPDALLLTGDVQTRPEGMHHVAEFAIAQGERVAFQLAYFPSHEAPPPPRDTEALVAQSEDAWLEWARDSSYDGEYRELVVRSLLTLRALTYRPTGGIVAAPTTSLPEKVGGVRNWDYRYCWLRDATFTLYALLIAGHANAALDWRNWLLRAVAGAPADLQIVYSVRGTRRLPEFELPWLDGYEGSKPVRIGNDAHGQFQLDVYGEVIDLLYASHRFGLESSDDEWALATAIVNEVEKRWREPDRGLWEIRGDPQHFTHSKVMAWVALDRAVTSVETMGFAGPVERWRQVRDEIHADVCARAYDPDRRTFTQYYDSTALDASTLLLPAVGFLPPDDPRIAGTVAAIERELIVEGFVLRYTQSDLGGPDPLPPGEGAFLACSFWLVDAYVLAGRDRDARALFERLAALVNDVGLLSEEYDSAARRQIGNFPQAFSHVGLINSAFNISHHTSPSQERAK